MDREPIALLLLASYHSINIYLRYFLRALDCNSKSLSYRWW